MDGSALERSRVFYARYYRLAALIPDKEWNRAIANLPSICCGWLDRERTTNDAAPYGNSFEREIVLREGFGLCCVDMNRRTRLAAAGSGAAAALTTPEAQERRARDSTAFFFKPEKILMWDTWAYYYENIFYLYYLTAGFRERTFNGVGLAISNDGVFWKDCGKIIKRAVDATSMGSGAVWPVIGNAGQVEKFVMNFSEFRGSDSQERQTIFFAESRDLAHWTRMGSEYEFRQDARWYEPKGRWDNIWSVPRPGGGYYGYWAATPKDGKVGLGFGESIDGVTWEALEPPALRDVPLGPPVLRSPEVGAVHAWGGQYYALVGLDDLESTVNNDFTDFRPGHTTFIADSPSGPFSPSPKNRRLLVGNASYFIRFVETPDGVLANHHSWEIRQGGLLNIEDGTTCMTPFKRAVWDEAGVLRLKWWENGEKAKGRQVHLEALWDTAFDTKEMLIIEGMMLLSSAPVGLYLQGGDNRGTGFLVYRNGLVEYGDLNRDGTCFEKKGYVDRELALEDVAHFRLVRKGRITEFYLNDYLMQCYCLPEHGTGRVDLVGSHDDFRELQAWYGA